MTSKSYVAMFSDGVYLARLLLAYGIDPVTRTSYPSGDGQDMNLCMACTVWAGKEPNRDLYDRNVLLYAITDRHLLPGDEPRRRAALASLASGWARGGIDYLQIREKDLDADELLLLAREVVAAVAEERTGIKVLLNGPAEIALEAGADGVHLPGNAAPDAVARALKLFAAAGRRAVISRACHSAAEAAGGDAGLLLYAPVFEKTLPSHATSGEALPGQGLSALAEACRAAGSTPVLALGGVTAENAAACVAAGAAGVAAIRLFLGAEWRKLRSL